MSFMFGNPSNGAAKSQQSKSQIRKVARSSLNPLTNRSQTPPNKPVPVDRYELSKNPKFQNGAGAAPKVKNVKSVQEAKVVKKSHLSTAQKSAKRKSASPLPTFSSDSEGDDGNDALGEHMNKKPRHDFSRDPKRRIRDVRHWEKVTGDDFNFVQGRDLTIGPQAKIYRPVFDNAEDSIAEIALQYPGSIRKEAFSLVAPRMMNEFSPLDEVIRVMRVALEHCLPSSTSKPLLDESTGLEYRLKRAWRLLDQEGFLVVINEYNNIIIEARDNGSSAQALDQMAHLPSPLVELILDQIFARTVSPKVESLKQYEAFSDNTYGELKPPFVSEIFQQTGLTSSSTFLDLGSGVGNVVLQAALEIGCDSHGIEVMENPCALARAQAQEFPNRCRLWGISVGSVNLLQGNFLEDTRITSVLQKADVILVNNQAFQPELNANLTQLFLDLKEGAKIVSLKSFVPHKWRLDERTRDSIIGVLEVERKAYWSGCVSWKDEGGDYYITTKDTSRINRILDSNRRRR